MTASSPPSDAAATAPAAPNGGGVALQAAGVALFLFIPLVLFLFVRHPAPIGASLAAGVALMLGHRFLARPFMARAARGKCLWCNRLTSPSRPAAALLLATGGGVVAARCCAWHRAAAARFLRFLGPARWPLRLGIFVPLALLFAALAAAALGHASLLPAATALFQLAVGLTVSAAAWGYLLTPAAAAPGADAGPIAVPFPAHNFFLLGLRLLLWIFRLVGAWWIWRGASFWL